MLEKFKDFSGVILRTLATVSSLLVRSLNLLILVRSSVIISHPGCFKTLG